MEAAVDGLWDLLGFCLLLKAMGGDLLAMRILESFLNRDCFFIY